MRYYKGIERSIRPQVFSRIAAETLLESSRIIFDEVFFAEIDIG